MEGASRVSVNSAEMRTVAVVLPTLNAAAFLPQLIDTLSRQSLRPKAIVLVDSSSTDGTAELARAAGWIVEVIPRQSFRHGATRHYATGLVGADVYVFLTQDALPAADDSVERLVDALYAEPDLGVVFGRHLPRPGCSPIAAHNRLFNYPAKSQTKRLGDAARLGLKTCFSSDVFAAYRADALRAVGSFPRHVIGCEDVHVAARMQKAGYAVGYVAEAQVFHSHDHGLLQDFRVFFDIGAFYSRDSWILTEFGKMEGEGIEYLVSEIRFLIENKMSRFIFLSLLTLGVKYFGFILGRHSKIIPNLIRRKLSSFPSYWD